MFLCVYGFHIFSNRHERTPLIYARYNQTLGLTTWIRVAVHAIIHKVLEYYRRQMMKQLDIYTPYPKASDNFTGDQSFGNEGMEVMGLRRNHGGKLQTGSAEMQEWLEIETALNTVQMVCMIQGLMSLVLTVLFKKLRKQEL